jgi:hypothetical protein
MSGKNLLSVSTGMSRARLKPLVQFRQKDSICELDKSHSTDPQKLQRYEISSLSLDKGCRFRMKHITLFIYLHSVYLHNVFRVVIIVRYRVTQMQPLAHILAYLPLAAVEILGLDGYSRLGG